MSNEKNLYTPKSFALSPLLFDSMANLLFCTIIVLILRGILPLPIVFTERAPVDIVHPFSEQFLTFFIPAMIVLSSLNIVENIVKALIRYWKPVVCLTVIANNLLSLAIWLFLLNQPNVFTDEMEHFLDNLNFALLTDNSVQSILLIAMAVLTVGFIGSCITAVLKTLQARKNFV